MTVATTASRIIYAGNGATTSFPVPFQVYSAATDLEVILLDTTSGAELDQSPGVHFDWTGTENDTGSCDFFFAPSAGWNVVIQRRTKRLQDTDYVDYDAFPAASHERALDRQTLGLQDLAREQARGLRVPRSDTTDDLTLPPRALRRNRYLAFDGLGAPLMLPGNDGSLSTVTPNGGTETFSLSDLLGREVDPRSFGAKFDGVTDDRAAIQAAAGFAALRGRPLLLCEGTARILGTIYVPGAVPVVRATGLLVMAGAGSALVLGDQAATSQNRRYLGLRVKRETQSDWTDWSIGIAIFNLDASFVEIVQAEGFTIGVRLAGDGGRGMEDTEIHYGRIVNNHIGLQLWCETAASWCNSLRHHGGHFANASSVNTITARYGVDFGAAAGAYPRHNAHAFYGPGFELQRQGTPGTVEAIPFRISVTDARGIRAHDVRMEGCSPFVVRVMGQVSDAEFGISYVGTYGWRGAEILYDAGVPRNGVTVLPGHGAQAALGTPRLFADASSVRALAYRDNTVSASGQGLTGGIGFEKLAVLSSNPTSPPLNINGLLLPGLTLVDGTTRLLTGDAVGLHSGRAIGFLVDVSRCKEVMLAAEGVKLRLVVMQFGADEGLLQQDHPVNLSGANILWNPGSDGEGHYIEGAGNSRWWEMNVNLDEPLAIMVGGVEVESIQQINMLQRIRMAPAAAYAFIGVKGGENGALLLSLRLYCSALHSPPVIYGAGRAWGQRERTYQITDDIETLHIFSGGDFPGLAAGASTSFRVTAATARHGDAVTANFVLDTGYSSDSGWLDIRPVIQAPGVVRIWITNRHATEALDLGTGRFYLTVTKPRL